MGSISIWQILIIFLVIALLFGMGRLPTLAKDLGKAIKEFRSSMGGSDENSGNKGAGKKSPSRKNSRKK